MWDNDGFTTTIGKKQKSDNYFHTYKLFKFCIFDNTCTILTSIASAKQELLHEGCGRQHEPSGVDQHRDQHPEYNNSCIPQVANVCSMTAHHCR